MYFFLIFFLLGGGGHCLFSYYQLEKKESQNKDTYILHYQEMCVSITHNCVSTVNNWDL